MAKKQEQAKLQHPDKFAWEEGDVRIFRNEGEWRAYVARKKKAEEKRAAEAKKKK